MMRRPRVLLADYQQMFVAGLKSLLEPTFDVVGWVFDGCALLKAAAKLRPDVIVLDITMPRLNGLDAAHELKQIVPGAKLIFLTMNEDPYTVGEAFRAGASVYLLKQATGLELTNAIKRVLKGGSYTTPRAAEGQINISLRGSDEREHRRDVTARQREVIQLLAEGRTMPKIGKALNITTRTVAEHKYRIMEKLQIKNSAGLVAFAIKQGMISA